MLRLVWKRSVRVKRRSKILVGIAVGAAVLAVPGFAAFKSSLSLPFDALVGSRMEGVSMIPGPVAKMAKTPAYTAQRQYHLHTDEDVLSNLREELNEQPCYRIQQHDRESMYLTHSGKCPLHHDTRDHTINIFGGAGEYIIQYAILNADPTLAERASIVITKQPPATYGYQREYWSLRKEL